MKIKFTLQHSLGLKEQSEIFELPELGISYEFFCNVPYSVIKTELKKALDQWVVSNVNARYDIIIEEEKNEG